MVLPSSHPRLQGPYHVENASRTNISAQIHMDKIEASFSTSAVTMSTTNVQVGRLVNQKQIWQQPINRFSPTRSHVSISDRSSPGPTSRHDQPGPMPNLFLSEGARQVNTSCSKQALPLVFLLGVCKVWCTRF